MNISKSVLLLTLGMFSLCLINNTQADASVTPSIPTKNIVNKKDFFETVNSVTSKQSFKDMSNEAKEQVLTKISDKTPENVKNEVVNELSKSHKDLIKQVGSPSNDSNKTISDSGTELNVHSYDISEDLGNPVGIQALRAGHYDITKKYGNRAYVIDAGWNYKGVGVGDEKLTLHYHLGKAGMKMRYSSTSGTFLFLGTISAKSKTTDSSAKKVGQNINAYGRYNFTVIKTLYSATDTIHGAVRIDSWNKSAKHMKLHESWHS